MEFGNIWKRIVALLAIIGLSSAWKTYEGYQVIQTNILSGQDVTNLVSLANDPDFDFWSRPRPMKSSEIMVGPQNSFRLQMLLENFGLEPSVLIQDVAKSVSYEKMRINELKSKVAEKAPNWDVFMNLEEIDNYVLQVASDFPDLCTLHTIGISLELRPMHVLQISTAPAAGKPAIFIDSAMHAREWIGPPVALYAINQLTEFFDQNSALLENVDFFIMPVVNPDGYLFSWQEDRFWRKTRNPNTGSECMGVDANRNFEWQWTFDNDTCSQVYPGKFATSEVEIFQLQKFLKEHPEITFYVDLHSYGQSMIFPWASSNDQTPMFSELMRVGLSAADALRAVRGTNYTVHTVTNGGTDFLNGVSVDWVHGVLGVPLAYAVELPKGGSGGFDIPPEQILPVATETWEAIKVYAQNVPPARLPIF